MAKSGEKKGRGKGKKSEPKEKVLQLTALEMKDLSLFEARRETQRYVMESLRQKDQLLTLDYKQKQAEIRAKMVATKASQLEITREHNEFVAKVEKRLGIKLPDYTYDESGVLTYNPVEEPQPDNGETSPQDGDNQAK
jgi:hypothetical protein